MANDDAILIMPLENGKVDDSATDLVVKMTYNGLTRSYESSHPEFSVGVYGDGIDGPFHRFKSVSISVTIDPAHRLVGEIGAAMSKFSGDATKFAGAARELILDACTDIADNTPPPPNKPAYGRLKSSGHYGSGKKR